MKRIWQIGRVYKKNSQINLQKQMAYKYNFFIRCFAMIIADLIGPIIMILIYTNTSGIPGWTLNEFIFFQGTLIFIYGMGHVFFMSLVGEIIGSVRKGTFDMILLKPYNPLTYITSSVFDWDGLAEVFLGLVLIIFSFIHLDLSVFSSDFLVYVLIILFAVLFQYALMIFVASLTFILVNSWAVFDVVMKLTDFGRYPLTVYGQSIRFFITFLFPVAISAYYPVSVFLTGLNFIILLKIIIPVILFFILSLVLWHYAMKKYTSAGG